MTDATQTAVIIAFFGFLVLCLVGIVGWGVKSWLKDHNRREEKREARAEERDQELTRAIGGLQQSVASLSEKFVLKTDYNRDKELLWERRRRTPEPREGAA